MRRLPMLAALAALAALGACGFDQSGPPPGNVLRDDTAADLRAAGSSLDGAEISDSGLITPLAWVTGAGIAKGANSELFTDPTTIDWNTIDANTAARVALSAPLGDFGDKAPIGIGITQPDQFTMWLDGEVWLEAGLHIFQLAADDNGFLDLAQPGGAFTRVVADQWFEGPHTGTFSAPADGWYPIHIAMSEGAGQASYLLEHQPPNATALAPFDPDRLRVAVGAQRGIVADAFDDFELVRPTARGFLSAPLLDQALGSAVPPDSGITTANGYSFHWACQIRIDVGGDYAFLVDTDDGHRVRIDGQIITDKLSQTPVKETLPAVHLDPGWHDVVIDYTQYIAGSHARLTIANGPELAGMTIPLDRVRPVVPRTDRVAADYDPTDLAWPASGSVAYAFQPSIPTDATIAGIDVEYTLDAPHAANVEVDAIAPDGSVAILRPQGTTDRTTAVIEYKNSHALDGKLAAGTWHLQFVDRGGVNGGNARDGAITVHYTGGHAPIVPTSVYESAPHDLGGKSRIDEVTYSASAPTGTSVVVRLRTGTNADDLMAQPWSDPVTSGQPPIVGAGQLVQYRVELTSDGDHSPSFDWIELVYRATI
jgi:subtilisin-like proprotein convertase family protein